MLQVLTCQKLRKRLLSDPTPMKNKKWKILISHSRKLKKHNFFIFLIFQRSHKHRVIIHLNITYCCSSTSNGFFFFFILEHLLPIFSVLIQRFFLKFERVFLLQKSTREDFQKKYCGDSIENSRRNVSRNFFWSSSRESSKNFFGVLFKDNPAEFPHGFFKDFFFEIFPRKYHKILFQGSLQKHS